MKIFVPFSLDQHMLVRNLMHIIKGVANCPIELDKVIKYKKYVFINTAHIFLSTSSVLTIITCTSILVASR